MNVIWFVVDTLRADHLGCYGYFRDTSPNIDGLAREGVLFEDSYASSSPTGPGFTSLITGLYAINHGFYLTPHNLPNEGLLDDRIVTLPELIQARGDYTTVAFDNLMSFRSHMKQFVRGCEYYVNITRSPAWLHHWVNAEDVNRRLLPWLEHHADESFFAFVHYWDPHAPYNMPDEFRGRFDRKRDGLETRVAPDGYEYVPGWCPAARLSGDEEPCEEYGTGFPKAIMDRLPSSWKRMTIDRYDDEVLYTDYSVGLVLNKVRELGLWDDTVIIVTSDHGEDLNLHGIWQHGTLHESTITVPLIIRDPQHLPQGERVSSLVGHVDNLPTILEYFPHQDRPHFERVTVPFKMPAVPARYDGAALQPLVRGEREGRSEMVVESLEDRVYLAPPWKLIWHKSGQKPELFHVDNDPLELNDRAAEEGAVVRDLSDRLSAWVEGNLGGTRQDPILGGGESAWRRYDREI